MKITFLKSKLGLTLAAAGVVAILAGCASMSPMMGGQRIELSGSNQVPPVTTSATGTATVNIKDDRSVTASVTVTGMTATASHIHEAAAGANGPVIVPFTKTGDNTFASAPGAKLTEAQYAAYKAGNLYVNVHSARNPGGEVRGQLKGN
ncbi:MAG: CHRD domain-containing protein [Betaproteobacteria bacterium]